MKISAAFDEIPNDLECRPARRLALFFQRDKNLTAGFVAACYRAVTNELTRTITAPTIAGRHNSRPTN
jgi:hypothetical protein